MIIIEMNLTLDFVGYENNRFRVVIDGLTVTVERCVRNAAGDPSWIPHPQPGDYKFPREQIERIALRRLAAMCAPGAGARDVIDLGTFKWVDQLGKEQQ